MKTKIPRHLLIAALLLLPTWAAAQTSTIPSIISYQGRVLDSSGNPVGTGAPVNRTVIFRIWDHPSSTQVANLIYSEQQTVTIADGEFSVLLGQGTTNGTQTFSYSETAKGPPTVILSNAFNGTSRYLGVTVAAAATIATTDNEITPRQQIVSSAFALRAKEAETLSSAVNINTGTLADARLSTNVSLFGQSIEAAEITNGNVTAAKLGSDVGVWSVSGGNVYRASGFVGIGKSNPSTELDVEGSIFARGLDVRAGGGAPYVDFSSSTNDYDARVQWNPGSSHLDFSAPNFWFSSNVTVNGSMRSVGSAVIGSGSLQGKQALDVNGAINVRGAHIVYDSSGGVVNWGPGGSLLFRTLITQGEISNYTDRLAITGTGNVGIGTTTPASKLDVVGDIKATGDIVTTTGNIISSSLFAGQACELKVPGGTSYIDFTTDNNAATDYNARIEYSGGVNGILGFNSPKCYFARNVAIGNNSDVNNTAPLHVSGTTRVLNTVAKYFDTASSGLGNKALHNWSPTIYCEGTMKANEYYAVSDSRIKNIAGLSDGGLDLGSLMGIEITNYSLKDTIEKGAGNYKKVIAQQVEKVYPQAVSLSTDVIPDIYQKADIKDGWVELKTDLKPGDKVRLISKKGDQDLHEVAEVKEGKFRTLNAPEGSEVFVYGRQVDDFRSVDYEAIAMLNVSATQQIKREKDSEVKALLGENAALKARVVALEAQSERVAALESRDQAITAKLAALEKLLASSGKADVLPISVNKSTASEP